MELSQLEYYRVLCKYGNYTRASRELNISQPAISAAIKKLAAECEDPLVVKNGGAFSLTPKGEVLQNWAIRIHNDIEGLERDLDAFNLRKRKIIRVALPFPLCPELLEEKIPRFGSEHTDIALHLLQEGHTQIVSGIKNRSIDIGIICKDMLDDDLDWKHYKDLEYRACFPEGHRFSGLEYISAPDLKDEKLIIPRMGNSISQSIREYFRSYDIEPDYSLVDVFPADVWQLAEQGKGIAFMPAHSCGKNSVPLSPPLYSRLVVVWKKQNGLDRDFKELIDFICPEGSDN